MGTSQYVFAFIVLVFVLALIALTGVILRRFAPGAMMRWRPGQERRLGVTEMLALDPKRRLVLVRRDDVEHLLLLGASNEVVVETNIQRPFRTALAEADKGPDPLSGAPLSERREPTL
jgi:flagellar protein FliO/FliZ